MRAKSYLHPVMFVLLLAASNLARAYPVTFEAEWREFTSVTGDGIFTFGPGTMTATLSLDSSLIPSFVGQPPLTPFYGSYENPTVITLNNNPSVFSLEFSVQNSGAFDGSWDLVDFDVFVVQTWIPLDYSKELVGQLIWAQSGGCSFGIPNLYGDCRTASQLGTFSFGSPTTSNFPGRAINSTAYAFGPSDPSQTLFHLTSVRLVPAPGVLALLLPGLAGFYVARRNCKQ